MNANSYFSLSLTASSLSSLLKVHIDDDHDEAVSDNKKYDLLLTRSFFDHCNSFRMQNVRDYPHGI